MLQIGVDSFAAFANDAADDARPDGSTVLRNLVEQIECADRVGLDNFGVGEHHRPDFLDSAPSVILAAAAARTRTIRLTSAVTVLSAADPVRVFQEFATLDLISGGRAEIVAGRGSFIESFPLFGYRLEDYDALFEEKLALLLALRDDEHVTWSGRFRPPLSGQGVYPRPLQKQLPVWLGIGGTEASARRAGTLGLPLMIAIIGGQPARFRPLVDVYRDAGRRAGHPPGALRVGVHALGYVAASTQQAIDDYYPSYARAFTAIGKERGWPPVTRRDFDFVRGPKGALVVGSVEEAIDKILWYDEALGGLARFSVQLGASALPHEKLINAIELLGTQVAPAVRERRNRYGEGAA